VSADVIQHPVSFDLDNRTSLIGYSLELGEAVPGELSITLYWRAVAKMSDDYHVFVHVIDGAGRRIGQGDGPPLDGAYRTPYWQPGETLADRHRVVVDGGALPAGASMRVGLYRLSDGTRLPARAAGGNRLVDDAISLPLKIPR
jgi:hypothetical protein